MEVRFDVEGDSDEKVFARLFSRYIARWAQQQHQQACRDKNARHERALGDGGGSDH
jgi:hypothetical protein